MTQFFSAAASKTCMAVAFTIFAILAFTSGASAYGDEFDRIDSKAVKIQKKARLLIKETVHYRHTAQYGSLVGATNKLCSAASHVHEVVHFANNLNHLQADLATLDHCFHQLESLFAAAEDSASRGRGEIHGSTGYAKSLLRSIEKSIDLMRRDVRKLQSRSTGQHHTYHSPKPEANSVTRHHYSQPVAIKPKTRSAKSRTTHRGINTDLRNRR